MWLHESLATVSVVLFFGIFNEAERSHVVGNTSWVYTVLNSKSHTSASSKCDLFGRIDIMIRGQGNMWSCSYLNANSIQHSHADIRGKWKCGFGSRQEERTFYLQNSFIYIQMFFFDILILCLSMCGHLNVAGFSFPLDSYFHIDCLLSRLKTPLAHTFVHRCCITGSV